MAGYVEPGSTMERRVVEKLKGIIEEHVDWTTLHTIPVVKWEWSKCMVRVNGEEYECSPLPYASKSIGEGLALQASTLRVVAGGLNGRVLLYKYPESILELRFMVGEALKAGAEAVVLIGGKGRRMSDAVLSSSIPVMNPDTPPGIPVVVLEADAARNLQREEARITVEVDAGLSEATGRTLVAGVNGDEGNVIHVSTHHDGLPGDAGFIERYSEILRDIVASAATVGGSSVILISFTAKEHGDPWLNSYTWSWGSRHLLGILSSKSELEKVVLDINVEAGGGDNASIVDNPAPILSYSSIPTGIHLNEAGAHFALDSLTYLGHGVPAVALTGLKPDVIINHEGLKRLTQHLVEAARDPEAMLRSMWRGLIGKLGDVPLEHRDLLARIHESSRLLGPRGAVRALTRYVSTLSSIYLVTGTGFHACISHMGYSAALRGCRGILEEASEMYGRVVAWGLSGIVLDARVKLKILEDVARRIDSATLIKSNELFNKTLELEACRQSLKGVVDERQEEHRDR